MENIYEIIRYNMNLNELRILKIFFTELARQRLFGNGTMPAFSRDLPSAGDETVVVEPPVTVTLVAQSVSSTQPPALLPAV